MKLVIEDKGEYFNVDGVNLDDWEEPPWGRRSVDLQSFEESEVKGRISKSEIRRACRLVFENAAELRKEWEKFHGKI
jgi:hypothetical protein